MTGMPRLATLWSTAPIRHRSHDSGRLLWAAALDGYAIAPCDGADIERLRAREFRLIR
jgi:hypothetical protein